MNKKILCLSIIFLSIDLLSKYLIDKFFTLLKSITIINKFFYLTKVYNDGASWSILKGQKIILILITFIFLTVLIIYQKKFKENKRNILAFSLLYGGIIGNLIERIKNGYVIDFLDFYLFNYNYPVFNLADIFIVIGILLLIIAIYKKEDVNDCSSK